MLIDLNAKRNLRAARREMAGPLLVTIGDNTYELPRELPIDLVDRLLDPEIEIAQLLMTTFEAFRANRENDTAADLILDVLGDKPELPYGIGRAVYGTVERLFGPEQWASFHAQASLDDLFALLQGLVKSYGAALGEAWRSPGSAATAGANSSATSNASIASTPDVSGFPRLMPDTSASAG